MPLRAARHFLSPKRAYPASEVVTKDDTGADVALRLSWVWTTSTHPDANLGDALSAVIVSAISRLPVLRTAFNSGIERLAAVGTIGHALHSGKVHLWGTGFDMARDQAGALTGYQIPDDTDLVVHAVRGRETADALRARGLVVPEAYGDPVWFLPRIFSDPGEKTHDLGVIVHISELDTPTAAAHVRATIERYRLPPEFAGRIRIINTYAPATLAGLRDKVAEIVSCRRILSTSLHGLVIAETYGIPCAWFGTYAGAAGRLQIGGSQPIDHRMRDFYSGVDRDYVLSYLQPLHQTTDWAAAIRFLDENWQPLDYTGERLFHAFPVKPQVRFSRKAWRDPDDILNTIPF